MGHSSAPKCGSGRVYGVPKIDPRPALAETQRPKPHLHASHCSIPVYARFGQVPL